MKIREIMSAELATIDTVSSLAEAVDVMRKHDCGFLPVLDPSSNALEGVITDRDIVLIAAEEDEALSELDVTLGMVSEVFVCGPDDTLDDVHQLLQQHKVRRLPVVDNGTLVGVISISDLARYAFSQTNGQPTDSIVQTMGVLSQPVPLTH